MAALQSGYIMAIYPKGHIGIVPNQGGTTEQSAFRPCNFIAGMKGFFIYIYEGIFRSINKVERVIL